MLVSYSRYPSSLDKLLMCQSCIAKILYEMAMPGHARKTPPPSHDIHHCRLVPHQTKEVLCTQRQLLDLDTLGSHSIERVRNAVERSTGLVQGVPLRANAARVVL
jgi:hypothetical protein